MHRTGFAQQYIRRHALRSYVSDVLKAAHLLSVCDHFFYEILYKTKTGISDIRVHLTFLLRAAAFERRIVQKLSDLLLPCRRPHRSSLDELIYNAAAAKVMKKHGIPINDLHSVVTQWEGYAEWKKGNDVHFPGAVYSKLAEKITGVILAKLQGSEDFKEK